MRGDPAAPAGLGHLACRVVHRDRVVGPVGRRVVPHLDVRRRQVRAHLRVFRALSIGTLTRSPSSYSMVTSRSFTDTTCAVSRSEEHTSELQSLMRISYAVFCLKKKTQSNLVQCSLFTPTNNSIDKSTYVHTTTQSHHLST